MFFQCVYDSALAHTAFRVGRQKTGKVVIIAPGFNAGIYLQTAQQDGIRIQFYPFNTLAKWLARHDPSNPILVDVRSLFEYLNGHTSRAKHGFLGTLLRKMGLLDGSKAVITHCQGGERSAITTGLRHRAGYNVTKLKDGYQAWRLVGLRIEHPMATIGN